MSTIVEDLASEDTVAVKLHRCAHVWLKLGPCWRVQKALDEQAIDYELIKGPNRPSKRNELEHLSGQRFYPVIELEGGCVYRAESKDMAARIRAGQLLGEAAAAACLCRSTTPY